MAMSAGAPSPEVPSGGVETAGRRTVSVLGSTGSIGCSTVQLLAANPARFQVRALVGGRNATLLAEQARLLRAELAVIAEDRKSVV